MRYSSILTLLLLAGSAFGQDARMVPWTPHEPTLATVLERVESIGGKIAAPS